MAEFCPECVRKVFGVDNKDEDYILSKELFFCEECCQLKRIVIAERKLHYLSFTDIFSDIVFFKKKKDGLF